MPRSRQLFALFLMLVPAVWMTGCAGQRIPDAPVERPLGSVTDQDRVAAMISIHAHAASPDRRFGEARIMDLDEAIDILVRDQGPAADSRRRRAVAKLWSWGNGREDLRSRVERLLARHPPLCLASIDEALRAEIRARRGGLTIPPAPWMFPIVQAIISNLLISMTPACPYVIPEPVGCVYDPPPIRWCYRVLIPRKMPDVARTLDPQSWAKTSPVFQKSYLVDTPSSCCPYVAGKSDCTVQLDGDDPLNGSGRPIGKPYAMTAFFESFCAGYDCGDCEDEAVDCQAAFKAILCADTDYDRWVPWQCSTQTADRYEVDYQFAVFRFGELVGNPTTKIKTDRGKLWVRTATPEERQGLIGADWSVVQVDKKLQFESITETIGVGTILQGLQAELRDQIVEQACHDVPEEKWCFAPLPRGLSVEEACPQCRETRR